MIEPEHKRARFLKQAMPFRLGSIAADLARVTSIAKHHPESRALDAMLEESVYLIEWTAVEPEPEIAAELVDIQRQLGLWRKAWPEAQKQSPQRTLLALPAKKWSDQILGYSGLLNE